MGERLVFVPLIIAGVALTVFWINQLIDVLGRDVRDFESHTHKLLWFLVVFCGSILGAIWYFLWKQGAPEERGARSEDDAYR